MWYFLDDVKLVRRRVIGYTLVLCLLGTAAYILAAVQDGSVAAIDVASIGLFTILFGWICFSTSMAVIGSLLHWRNNQRDAPRVVRPDGSEPLPLKGRVAILMPVYNEEPLTVLSALAAMRDQLCKAASSTDNECRHGHMEGDLFDFFVLSDTTKPCIQAREQQLISLLREECPNIFYRHRDQNTERKAGNVADFCERWGDAYRYMIVLDADSLMTADTLLAMTRRMDADERLGILQVPPIPIGRCSVFARVQQFSAAVYGPIFGSGLAAFAGDQGNYWGHNAIIRVSAFKRHCRLPTLKGMGSLGGEILSHDFVEAALLVRNGWKVCLATDLGGSFEECPTTVHDYAIRDHRWCQGNLQHWRLLLAEGFHPISRLHFASGILSYVLSPVWLLFLVVTCFTLSAPALADPMDRENWLPLSLFLGTMTLLFLPKVLAITALFMSRDASANHGGRLRLIGSFLLESFLLVLYAPINAVMHSRFVLAILRGRQVGWGAQQRMEQGLSVREACRDGLGFTALGIVSATAIYWLKPSVLPWMTPVLAGWILAVPLMMLLASTKVGTSLQKAGLLQISQELYPEPICELQQNWSDRLSTAR